MTIQSPLARISYTIAGAGPYSIPFMFLDDEDILVYSENELLAFTTDYTLAGAGDEIGGSLTLISPNDGDDLVIINSPAATQLVEYPEYGKFPAKQHERALDKLTILVKRLFDKLSRAVVIPDGTAGSSTLTPEPNKYIGWNAAGNALINLSGSGEVVDAQYVNYTPEGLGAVLISLADKLHERVSPMNKGAVGDGVTDDLAALKLALESGYPVDGCGRTYAINGTCAPTSFKGLFNAKLVQIGDNSATNIQTLKIVGISDFFIHNVTIDMGSNIETLFSDDGNSGLYVGGVDYETFIERFVINNVSVTGNGCGSGIQTRHAKNFAVSNCIVHDRVSGASPDPTNDSQDGIQFVNCRKFTVSNCRVSNLKTRLSGTPTIRWTRGFLFAECVDFAIGVCSSELVDQAYDFSGAYVAEYGYIGNRDFAVSGCVASDAGTYGFKFANVTHSGTVSGCVAHNIGSIGFVVSCAPSIPAGLEHLLTHNIDFIGCKAINMFGTGSAGTNATGFRVMAGSTYTDYPRGVRFKNCRVEDDQDTPTTTIGFSSDVSLPTYNTTDYDVSISNYVQGCSVDSSIATPYNSIGPVLCQITGTGNQAIPNGAVTEISWDAELSDFQELHNPASNPQNIYIKESGLYKIIAQIQFDTSATGHRLAKLNKNGSPIGRTTLTAASVSGSATSVAPETTVQLKSGDYISVSVYQNSGGSLNVRTNESYLSIVML